MESQQPAIACRNVTKKFNGLVAVDDVSLEIPSGICALVGPNGAGKSTLLNMLTGLMLPDQGDVRICGRPPADSRHVMGVMPEKSGLFDLLSIKEHLELAGDVYGLRKGDTRSRADGLVRVLGLDSTQNLFADECSHGMRKKTSLAVALLHAPRVLFLDEPFEGIDPASAITVQGLLREAAAGSSTVLFTSHTLGAVERIADRIIMIAAGKIVWDSALNGQSLTRPLEELYLSLIQHEPLEELSWLRSPRS
ncbi:MAG TPA: ABC transporter ATP-binding protein [Candidatus Angelobacter sp.]